MKDAIMQVRMDPNDKVKAERLYEALGMSFSEAIRIFTRQSILTGGLPFNVVLPEKPDAKMKAFSELTALTEAYPIFADNASEMIAEAVDEKYGSIG